MRTRIPFLLFAVTLMTTMSGPASASDGNMIDLGTLGGFDSHAEAINESGQVAGASRMADGAYHPFVWSQDGGMVDLGEMGWAVAINDAGQVVGRRPVSGWEQAFSWTSDGGIVDLGTLGGDVSYPEDVNNSGQVVGTAEAPESVNRCFVWTAAEGMIDIGSLGDGHCHASAINDAGQVAGWSAVAVPMVGDNAFLWSEESGMVDLGRLAPSEWGSYAFAINERGQVVGSSWTDDDTAVHAFSWTADGGMQDLGTLGGDVSEAVAVSDLGQVVGFSETGSGERHGFSWTRTGGMVDLGTLGGEQSTAIDVNNAGWVIGNSNTADGRSHAFIWSAARGMIDLGTLGGNYSTAKGLNNSTQVVGTSDATVGTRAFLWTEEAVWEASIDVRPGRYPNRINPSSRGVIPVAILSTSVSDGEAVDFDATRIDPLSVAFGPLGAGIAHRAGHINDVDSDGDQDLLLHFRVRETGIDCGDTEVALTAETHSGAAVTGADSIRTVGCPRE